MKPVLDLKVPTIGFIGKTAVAGVALALVYKYAVPASWKTKISGILF